MKYLLCLVLGAIALGEGKKITISVPQEMVPAVLKSATECQEKVGVQPDVLSTLMSASFTDTEPFKNWLYCFAKSLAYLDEEDNIIIDKVMKILRLGSQAKTNAELEKVVSECKKLKGSDKRDSLFKFTKCIHETFVATFE